MGQARGTTLCELPLDEIRTVSQLLSRLVMSSITPLLGLAASSWMLHTEGSQCLGCVQCCSGMENFRKVQEKGKHGILSFFCPFLCLRRAKRRTPNARRRLRLPLRLSTTGSETAAAKPRVKGLRMEVKTESPATVGTSVAQHRHAPGLYIAEHGVVIKQPS